LNKRTKAYIFLLTTTIIWGAASPVIKYTLKFISPFSFLFWRFLITSLIFLPIFFIYINKNNIKLDLKKIARLAGLGFLGTTFSLTLLFVGYSHTTAIDGSLIYSIAPILVVVGGAFFLKEEVTGIEKMGAAIAFLGSIVAIIQPLLERKAFGLENMAGNILVFLSALAWAGYCLLMRRSEFKEKTDPLVLTAVSFFAGFITIIPLFIIERPQLPGNCLAIASLLNNHALPGILYMSVFSSVIAYFTYNLGYSLIEASEAVLFDYLKPVFAAPLAVIWLDEQITPPFLIGALLIALGVFLTESRPKS